MEMQHGDKEYLKLRAGIEKDKIFKILQLLNNWKFLY